MRFLRGTSLTIAVLLALRSAAGEPPVRLTTDGRLKQDPVFVSPSGDELLYTVQARPVQFQLMRMRLRPAASPSQPVNPTQMNSEFEPAVSFDGRYLAFVQSRGNLSLGLVIRDLGSGREAEVKPGGGFSGMRSPTFSPDTTRVVFSYPEGGQQRLLSVDLNGSDQRVLLDGPGIHNWPDFAADGRRLVFAATRDGDFEIYTAAAADGSGLRRLTQSPGQDIRPRFSPDSQRIAFTSNRDGNYEIYVMDESGANQRRITDHPERDDYADWHPDGRHLVVVSERDGDFDLYLLPVP